MKPTFIAIAGGTASGKSSIVKIITDKLKEKAVLISMDSYYKSFDELNFKDKLKINFDHPSSFETKKLVDDLKALRRGEPIFIPVYDFITYERTEETIPMDPHPLVIVEGLFVLAEPKLRKLFDVSVFVDADSDERLIRRINRDIRDRGRDLESVITQYQTQVKPMHEEFVEPSKKYADIIIPRGAHNRQGMKLLLTYLKKLAKSW